MLPHCLCRRIAYRTDWSRLECGRWLISILGRDNLYPDWGFFLSPCRKISRVRFCAWLIRQVLYWIIVFIDTFYTQLGTTGNYSAIADLHTLQFTVVPTSVHGLHLSYPGNGFITVSLPLQITHEVFFAQPNSSFAIILPTANSGDSLSCLLQLLTAELNSVIILVEVEVTLRLTVSQSVSLGVEPHVGLMTRYIFLFDNCGLAFWGALSDERTGLCFVYATGPCQRSFFRVRVPWDSQPYLVSQIWDFPFLRLLRLAGSRWRYCSIVRSSLYNLGAAPTENTAACWFTAAELCLPQRCIAKGAAQITENTALLLLRAFASEGMYLSSYCLTMNYSGFQASCHCM
jgi:hypothetical protein